MKTIKQVPVELIELKDGEYVPDKMEFGKIYYSKEFKGTNHMCLCGCGHQCYLPIKDGEWSLLTNNGNVTIIPSISQRFDCKSHYIITNGKANFV
jgi:hypothetical protein